MMQKFGACQVKRVDRTETTTGTEVVLTLAPVAKETEFQRFSGGFLSGWNIATEVRVSAPSSLDVRSGDTVSSRR